MTSRELVLQTLEFRNKTERVPRELWTLPWVYSRFPEVLKELDEDYEWDLSDPSPWISAKQFNNFWSGRVVVETYSSSEIRANPSKVYNRPFFQGDVIQILYKDFWGKPGNGWHTMFITGYGSYNGNTSFQLTYHSLDTYNKNLIQIAEQYPNDYFRFFTIK